MVKAFIFVFWVSFIAPDGEPLSIQSQFTFVNEEDCRKVEFLTTNKHEVGQCDWEWTIQKDNLHSNNLGRLLNQEES